MKWRNLKLSVPSLPVPAVKTTLTVAGARCAQAEAGVGYSTGSDEQTKILMARAL